MIEQYSFFMTAKGFFRFAPAGIARNDVVVAFHGLPGPYIVRPAPGTLDFFFFSSCYVHSMMDARFEYSDEYQLIPLV